MELVNDMEDLSLKGQDGGNGGKDNDEKGKKRDEEEKGAERKAFDLLRPANAIARGLVLVCAEPFCHRCVDRPHPDEPATDDGGDNDVQQHHADCQCTSDLEAVEGPDDMIRAASVYKWYIHNHLDANRRVAVTRACLCRISIADVTDLRVATVANDEKSMSVVLSLCTPELTGTSDVVETEPFEVDKIEDRELEWDEDVYVTVAGQRWRVYFTQQDCDALQATYERKAMQADHDGWHRNRYQHLTCPLCVGEQPARQARVMRENWRRAFIDNNFELRQQLIKAYAERRIDQAMYEARYRLLHRRYDILVGDLELRREFKLRDQIKAEMKAKQEQQKQQKPNSA